MGRGGSGDRGEKGTSLRGPLSSRIESSKPPCNQNERQFLLPFFPRHPTALYLPLTPLLSFPLSVFLSIFLRPPIFFFPRSGEKRGRKEESKETRERTNGTCPRLYRFITGVLYRRTDDDQTTTSQTMLDPLSRQTSASANSFPVGLRGLFRTFPCGDCDRCIFHT